MGDNEKFDLILSKLDKSEERFDKLEGRFDKFEERFDKFEGRVDKLEERFDKLDLSVRDIKLTLENETNKNIMRVAEGHLDLSRKLDEALKIENEKEMIAIRVNILENELRRLKERLEQIA